MYNDLKRMSDESEEKYIWRLGQLKDSGVLDMDWDEITDLINREFRDDTPYKEAAYRKPYSSAKRFYEAGVFGSKSGSSSDEDIIDEIRNERHELRKEKQRLFDERAALNKILRENARYEQDIDNLKEALLGIGTERYIKYRPIKRMSDSDLVVCLSDLHIGGNWCSVSGIYNTEIAKQRLETYLAKIIEIGDRHNAQKCYVVGLGDYISGSIHKTIAIQNRENVVEQIKTVCELVADFVYEIGKHFAEVEVHMVAGNHSRIDKKEDALTDERLDNLVLWFIKHILEPYDNIKVEDDEIDSTYVSFFVRDHLFFGCHGDYDTPTEASVGKLCMYAGMMPKVILTGHKHFPAMTEISGIKVIQSGSLCGSGDDYTRQKRLKGKPSQTVLVYNNTGIEAYYPVELD